MSRMRQMIAVLLQCAVLFTFSGSGLAAKKSAGQQLIRPADMQQWLAYFSSDEFEGRAIYTEGLGLAAAYIADQLKSLGVRAGGDNGSSEPTGSAPSFTISLLMPMAGLPSP
jgi:hypothetical protein